MVDGHEIAMALRGAYLAMHRQADAALSPFDLTANQFVLLALLDERDGVPQRDLVERAASDPNTIRPMLKSLQKAGYVVRETDPNDGRAWLVRITTQGRRTFRRVHRKTEAFREHLGSSLDVDEREAFVRMLGKVVDAMNGTVTEPA
ncbi:MarR family winged helix-turn-helix transcriptional regulator [Planctomycetes bacterium K23_9]|uniref:HTH-type transcriptional regulator MgrA n=1 Tax=Stieleria marina TaxID=1930275 RepID=A0A517NXY0_9BACT|nr:HTH-type transcriptional regulator MgrA [Planctomycetes bacterium K23_9]